MNEVITMAFYTGRKTLYEYIIQDIPDGFHTFQTVANGELVNIDVEFYNFYDDVEYDTDPVLGNDEPDTRMLILKYHKNLTIHPNVTVTPQVRKKGMFIFCMGELVNYGTISMTARGAHAKGQNVYLWENEDGTFEFIPATGASGANGILANSNMGTRAGIAGANGRNRSTGGGGSGGARYTYSTASYSATSGGGSAGTSYSGGTGGGGCYITTGSSSTTADSGSVNGGPGGHGRTNFSLGSGGGGGGGAGNPSGGGGTGRTGEEEGTGGLLIIFCEKRFINQHSGIIQSNGSKGVDGTGAGGGGSGGGSINIFTYQGFDNYGVVQAQGGSGGAGEAVGGNGGDGTVTIMQYNIETDKIFVLDDKYFRVDKVDLGNVLEGSYSPIKKFILENMYNIDLTKLELWWEPTDESSDSVILQLSKSRNPFIPEDKLVYEEIIPYRGRVEFYIRLIAEDGAKPGRFNLKVKVESKLE